MEKRKVIDIYREMIQRANYLRENLRQTEAQELFYFCAELERTEEVNPQVKTNGNDTKDSK